MNNLIKFLLFFTFVGYMILSLIVPIPEKYNNVFYGLIAVVALFFMFSNKESLGMNDVFKNKKQE